MFCRIRCFDLGDAISQRFVVGTHDCELPVHLQRELLVSLLEVQLRHCLVDERLSARARKGFFLGRVRDWLRRRCEGLRGRPKRVRFCLLLLRCGSFDWLRLLWRCPRSEWTAIFRDRARKTFRGGCARGYSEFFDSGAFGVGRLCDSLFGVGSW
jgi:hypothetical protein